MKRAITTLILAASLSVASTAIAGDKKIKKIEGPEVVETADVNVTLNGLVCDFCSIALNKTFKKQASVQGTFVDLDTKLLSVDYFEGQSLSNEEIVKLVKQAGYTAVKITYADGTEFVPEES